MVANNHIAYIYSTCVVTEEILLSLTKWCGVSRKWLSAYTDDFPEYKLQTLWQTWSTENT